MPTDSNYSIEKMKNVIFITCCVSLIVAGCGKKHSNTQDWTFHTTPDKWKESRVFQTPFDNHWADRINIERIPATEITSEKIYSPNEAYWFSTTIIEPNSTNFMDRDVYLNIYNERDYLIKLNLLKVHRYNIHTTWINEKILYVRAWWGRVLGVDILFDVESEQIIYKEIVNDGGLAYIQWQQAKIEK